MRLILDNNETMELTGVSQNISLAGLQLTCSKETVDKLLAQEERPVVCQLMLFFNNMSAIEVPACKLIVNRRLKQDQYHLGFSFNEVEGELLEILESCISLLKEKEV